VFGQLEPAQIAVLEDLVRGKTVWALGSGSDLQEAWQLVGLRASTVYAVDKARRTFGPEFRQVRPSLWDCGAYFPEFSAWARDLPDPDLVFLKWPRESPQAGLIGLLARAPMVIYVGRNDGITACGGVDMWSHLQVRDLLQVVEGVRNDLLVYGGDVIKTSPRCREEEHALQF
jgi:hypothetical protein